MTELLWSSASALAAGAAPDSSSAHFHKWQHRALARWWRCSDVSLSLLPSLLPTLRRLLSVHEALSSRYGCPVLFDGM